MLGGEAMDLIAVEDMMGSATWLPPVMTLLPKVIIRRGLASIYLDPSSGSPILELLRLDLLICDELGYVTASKVGAELLFRVISTAVTSGRASW